MEKLLESIMQKIFGPASIIAATLSVVTIILINAKLQLSEDAAIGIILMGIGIFGFYMGILQFIVYLITLLYLKFKITSK